MKKEKYLACCGTIGADFTVFANIREGYKFKDKYEFPYFAEKRGGKYYITDGKTGMLIHTPAYPPCDTLGKCKKIIKALADTLYKVRWDNDEYLTLLDKVKSGEIPVKEYDYEKGDYYDVKINSDEFNY